MRLYALTQDDADPLAGRQGRLHPRHLHQRRGRHRTPDGSRDLALEDRQEAAVGGDGLGAEIDQVGRRGDEVHQQAGSAVQDDILGTGAAHDAEQHGKRPGRAVAHVTRDAREALFPASRMPSGAP